VRRLIGGLGAALALAAAPASAATRPVDALAKGVAAFRAEDYAKAATSLAAAAGHGLRADDWATYLLAESEFYLGRAAAAREHFARVAKGTGRLAELAPARVADCLWVEGDRKKAAAAYARVVAAAAKKPSAFVDVGVARFHLAEAAAARDEAAGRKLFLALARDLPAHPLGDEAERRAAIPAPAAAPGQTPPAPLADALPPEDRLKRAATLTKERHWDEALADLAKLPNELPPAVAARRDYQIGMTKFHMRRDYARAATLLLGAVANLPEDQAAEAQFHGARSLSRVDKDDEAIAGYKKVVERWPRSRWAAEAQYLSGWLDYNRGRFKESLPALEATLERYGKSNFADEAAWCVAFAHLLLGEADAAFAGLARYAKLPATGMTPGERATQIAYWRARLHEKIGHAAEARDGYRALVRDAPLSYYGLLAAARLGDDAKPELPGKAVADVAPKHPERDPTVARALELLSADLGVEAGAELQRDEKNVLRRAGGDPALPWLLGLYAKTSNFHRAYALAEAKDGGALDAAPTGGARAFWEAAYPRAYADLVEKYGPAAGNPDVWLYAIMRKESGFDPLDVSYADARGLLQMIPPTSARVAKTEKIAFAPDELYDPETNIRLGAAYIGALYKKFGGQVPLAAGAYNAGPRAMSKWCTQHAGHPTDEFIELIAFTQTREYAKRVTALYARYRYLYGPSPYKLPLVINAKPDAGGPDF
jgi:soluble lytic murein transglycosylase